MAQSQSRIVELASSIATGTAAIDEYLSGHGLPSPSFDADFPIALDLPDEIQQIRDSVLEASKELQALMLGPVGIVYHQTLDHTNLIGLQAIYRYGVALSFPPDGEASYREISQNCGLNEPDLRRIMRYAMTKHIFQEPRKGFVTHTSASKVLNQMPIMRDWVGMVCEEMWPSAVRTVDAMTKWPGSQEPNNTGFAIANSTDRPMFEELARFPTRLERFAQAMSMISNGEGFHPSHLVNAYPWENSNVNLFVDVGGSYGTSSIALAQAVPSIHCIVQDLSGVVSEGSSALSPELSGRVKFMSHDFFQEQPVMGADVYFFRWIFHDWSDKYCVRILQNLIPALKHGARLIINEFVIPSSSQASAYQEWLARAFDLAMLELFNSKEREEDDWVALLESAHSSFRLLGITQPPGSNLSFIEVVWEGSSSASEGECPGTALSVGTGGEDLNIRERVS